MVFGLRVFGRNLDNGGSWVRFHGEFDRGYLPTGCHLMITRVSILFCSSIALLSGCLAAQDFRSSDGSSALFPVRPAAFLSAEEVSSPLPTESSPSPVFRGMPESIPLQCFPGEDGGPSWRNRVLTGLGVALVGMGVGYFFSQVALSDWKETPESDPIQRTAWVAAGGSCV